MLLRPPCPIPSKPVYGAVRFPVLRARVWWYGCVVLSGGRRVQKRSGEQVASERGARSTTLLTQVLLLLLYCCCCTVAVVLRVRLSTTLLTQVLLVYGCTGVPVYCEGHCCTAWAIALYAIVLHAPYYIGLRLPNTTVLTLVLRCRTSRFKPCFATHRYQRRILSYCQCYCPNHAIRYALSGTGVMAADALSGTDIRRGATRPRRGPYYSSD